MQSVREKLEADGYVQRFEVARRVGCTPETVDHWIKTRGLRTARIGKFVFVKMDDVRAQLNLPEQMTA